MTMPASRSKGPYSLLMTALCCALAFGMAGCGGSAGSSAVTAPPADPVGGAGNPGGGGSAGVAIGGTIQNLAADGLVLQNGSEQLAVSNHAASFTFARQAQAQGTYAVQVLVQPTGQMCDVIHGSGTVGTAAPNDIAVACKTAMVSTIAGNTSWNAALAGPGLGLQLAIASDGAGNLYVANSDQSVVQKIDTRNIVSMQAGSLYPNGYGISGHQDGPALASTFYRPAGLTIDSAGNLLVADAGSRRIRKISTAGVVTTIAGNDEIGQLDGPVGVATFLNPHGIATDVAGNIYVADDQRIRKIGVDGMVSILAGGAFGHVDGQGKDASFLGLGAIVSDRTGKIFVTDGNLIRTVTPDGKVTTLSGSADDGTRCAPQLPIVIGTGPRCSVQGPPVNGPVAGATFARASGIAIDAKGNIYVADTLDGMIRVITPAGGVSTLAGTGAWGTTDGPGAGATLNQPIGVAVDSAGNVYVAEAGSNDSYRGTAPLYPRIRKIQFQ